MTKLDTKSSFLQNNKEMIIIILTKGQTDLSCHINGAQRVYMM